MECVEGSTLADEVKQRRRWTGRSRRPGAPDPRRSRARARGGPRPPRHQAAEPPSAARRHREDRGPGSPVPPRRPLRRPAASSARPSISRPGPRRGGDRRGGHLFARLRPLRASHGASPYVFETLPRAVVKHREESIPPVREPGPDVSERLEAAVMHSLARNPIALESAAAFAESSRRPRPGADAPLPQSAGVDATCMPPTQAGRRSSNPGASHGAPMAGGRGSGPRSRSSWSSGFSSGTRSPRRRRLHRLPRGGSRSSRCPRPTLPARRATLPIGFAKTPARAGRDYRSASRAAGLPSAGGRPALASDATQRGDEQVVSSLRSARTAPGRSASAPARLPGTRFGRPARRRPSSSPTE